MPALMVSKRRLRSCLRLSARLNAINSFHLAVYLQPAAQTSPALRLTVPRAAKHLYLVRWPPAAANV